MESSFLYTRLPWPSLRKPPRRSSEWNLRTHREGAVARQSEVLDRAGSVAGHRDEQLLAPALDHGRGCRSDGDLRDEVGGVLEVEVAFEQPSHAGELERLGDVDAVLIADPHVEVDHLEQAVSEQLDGESVVELDVWDADGLDGDDQDLLVQRVG